MTRTAILQLSVLALVLPGFVYSSSGQTSQASQAGRSYNYGHISYVEGEVTLQRAIEPEPSEAGVNEPVTPGDRAWTASYGRAEIRLADGSVLRMDRRTKVDFVAFGEAAGQENAGPTLETEASSSAWSMLPVPRFESTPPQEVSSPCRKV